MKYSININQKAAVDMGIRVDFVDLAIMDYASAFLHSSKCIRVISGDKEYGFIDPKSIIEQMPLLGITSTRGINIRLDKLIEAGLLVRCPDNVSLKKTFLRVGKRYDEYVGLAEAMDREPIESNQTPETMPAAEPTPVTTDTPAMRNARTLTLPFHGTAFLQAWEQLLREKEWKNKGANALKLSLSKLSKVSEAEAIEAINTTIENGWKGVFPRQGGYRTNTAQAYQPKSAKPVSTEDLMN